LIDPSPEFLHFFRGDLLLSRRHFPGRDAFDQQAAGGVAGMDRGTALATLDHEANQSKVELSLDFRSGSMAIEAVGTQDGSNFGLEGKGTALCRLGSPDAIRQGLKNKH
jgi:hypothetical protein